MSVPATLTDVAGVLPSLSVMFNPASLKVTVTNKLQDDDTAPSGAQGGSAHQNTQSTTTKLEMELIFDATDTGCDVRSGKGGTSSLRALGKVPDGPHPKIPTVDFRWGNFAFQGFIESLNETLDFWSDEGVPLRSTIQLTMQGSKVTLDQKSDPAKLGDAIGDQAFVFAPSGGTGTTGVVTKAKNPGAARALAALNGIADMRMAAGGGVAVSAGVTLRAAAAFSLSAGAGVSAKAGAGASAGFGIGAAASAGASAGFGIGASTSAGVSAGAGFGIGASAVAGAGIGPGASVRFGAVATAGVSASAGAFAGLGVSKTTSLSLPFDPAHLLPSPGALTTSSATRFDITGRATGGSTGLSARIDGRASAGVSII